MQKILVLFLVFITGNVYSEDTVIAIVNDNPISLNSVKNQLLNASSNKEKIDIINTKIDFILQLEKVNEFDLFAIEENINKVLIDIAQSNVISISYSI